jgi:hypothetical protein
MRLIGRIVLGGVGRKIQGFCRRIEIFSQEIITLDCTAMKRTSVREVGNHAR